MDDVKIVININKELANLPAHFIKIMTSVFSVCTKYNKEVYLVGGMVRNIILNKPGTDLDFVLISCYKDNNLEIILKKLAEKFDCDFLYNKNFQTGNLKLKGDLNLDFVVARKEYYPSPGSLPEVSTSTLKNDLKRRDFTINTLLMDIRPEKIGLVYDYLGGLEDLKKELIKVLHSKSFIDDPTRIIRGMRQAVELDFVIENKTLILMQNALEYNNFPALSSSRVFKEIRLLFKNKINNKFIKLLKRIPVFKLLSIDIKLNKNRVKTLYRLEGILAYFRRKNYNVKEWLLRITVILADIGQKDFSDWNINKYEEDVLTFTKPEINKYINILHSSKEPSLLVETLQNLTIEKNILLMLNDKITAEKIKYYYEKLNNIKISIDGNDLINLGLQSGPEIKNVLKQVWKAKVKGLINDYRDELNFAQKLIEDIERSNN